MAIDVSDLPPAYQAQALKKYLELQKQKKPSAHLPAAGPAGSGKYHNTPTCCSTPSGAVIRFDSKKEARRYDQLLALEKEGQIRDLRLQVDFTIQEAYTDIDGRRVRGIRYRADFTYRRPPDAEEQGREWPLVVEDVKSKETRTKEYLLKRKLLKDRFGIEITEV